jgi:anti-sigma regulatory factor (Ser/Thr protein kinase)
MERSFRRELSSLGPLSGFIGDFVFAHGLDDGTAFTVNLAIEEVFTNMVKYGGGGEEVSVGIELYDDNLVIELVHPGGVPFDAAAGGNVDVEEPLAARTPGGIGLHLVRSVMDDMAYEHSGGCARVRLTKRLGGD